MSIQRKKKEYTGTYPYQLQKCIHCRLETQDSMRKSAKLRLEAKAKANELFWGKKNA